MSLRDYEGDMPMPNCPEKIYIKNLKEELRLIKKRCGKDIARKFQEKEEELKNKYLNDIENRENENLPFIKRGCMPVILYERFKKNLWVRAGSYRNCMQNQS